MNTVDAILVVRDNLRINLTDLNSLASGGTARNGNQFIFANEPSVGSKYPKLEILKLNNPTVPISIGPEYTEFERLDLNIYVYVKNGYKVIVSGTEYKNAQLVEYYMGLIKTTLKAQFSTLFTAGFKGYKHTNTSTVDYSPNTQLYFGILTISGFYFNT